MAKVKTDSNNSDEEEEWFDATEELEASSQPAGGSWWEQDNVDAADVEAHLLRDIHEKGMQCHTLDKCDPSSTDLERFVYASFAAYVGINICCRRECVSLQNQPAGSNM